MCHSVPRRNLLNFPIEIKRPIYHDLFDNVLPEFVLCMCCKSATTFSKPLNVDILATCRQSRDEALAVFHDTLAETKLNLKQQTASYHGQPRPMRGHWMLESYGSSLLDIIIDAEDASDFQRMLS